VAPAVKVEEETKFSGKILKEFVPVLLSQYKDEPYMEYESFD